MVGRSLPIACVYCIGNGWLDGWDDIFGYQMNAENTVLFRKTIDGCGRALHQLFNV